MPATRNSSPLLFGDITIQPAITISPSNQSGNGVNSLVQPTTGPTTSAATSANFGNSSAQGTTSVQPILSPILNLAGNIRPYISPPVIFTPRPNPIARLTESDDIDETLTLDSYAFRDGQAILDVSSLRSEIITEIDYRSIYDTSGYPNIFGTYFMDLQQSSVIRDTLRKYLITNRAAAAPDFAAVLSRISARVSKDITESKRVVAYLDSLLQKTKEIGLVLDVKKNLSNSFVFQSPNMALKDFFTSRMLFSETAYEIFSDTKILYQMLFDLSGILDKCSFNLLDNFTDNERSTYIGNPASVRRQTAQDGITIDRTYGDNLRYTSNAIRSKYILDLVTMNGVLNVLPQGANNRIKFIVNLLSKELRVSKGLGKYKLTEGNYFGFRNQGNPFASVLGIVPNDIFLEPTGLNSLATLFYIKTGNQSVIVLPFENRQLVGDNETVFVLRNSYFSDRILKDDFSLYNNYRETFGTRVANSKGAFEKLLTKQADNDATSKDIQSLNILRTALNSYALSQNLIRNVNSDPTSVAVFVMFLAAGASINFKFELFKLLLLIIAYDTRRDVTQNTVRTDKFRDMLFSELSRQTIQGFTVPVTETNLASLLNTQLDVVKALFLSSATTTSVNQAGNLGSERNQAAAARDRENAQSLGLPVSQPRVIRRNNTTNTFIISTQQFSELTDALRSEQNLLRNVVDLAKLLFVACSDDDKPYHTVDGGTATRYNNLTITNYILLIYELFHMFVEQYAKSNMSYSVASTEGGGQMCQTIQVSFVGNDLEKISNNIRSFNSNQTQDDHNLTDYATKLVQEDQIISNVILFFDRLNQQLSNVASLSDAETQALAAMMTNNISNLSTTRTSKGVLSSIINKASSYNPTNNPNLAFYLPAGKAVSDKNFEAVKLALSHPAFLVGDKKIITVGIPHGFASAAMSAKLNKNDVYSGNLKETPSDVINIKIYRISKNDEGIIFKPQDIKFDLSLFSRGFDSYSIGQIQQLGYNGLVNSFEFYDFDEDEPFSEVTAKTVDMFVKFDPFYSVSSERKRLGLEVVANLFTSFIIDIYTHMLTGLNTAEETFVRYTEAELNGFATELGKVVAGTADLSKVKFMSPEYRDLLAAFRSNADDTKLMLTLCNDIPKSVFREKDYDRVLNVVFDPHMFPVDIDTMVQTNEGYTLVQSLWASGQLYEGKDGQGIPHTYKRDANYVIDQHFVSVELIQ